MIKQSDIDYQERRGNYWSTSLSNVVMRKGGLKPGEKVKKSGFWRDFAGLIIGVISIVGLFAVLFAWGL